MTAQQIITNLNLQRHPEGGFYSEVYRSEQKIEQACLPRAFNGDRNVCSAIYYLLQRGDYSAFHRIKSDEIWHFYSGGHLLLHLLGNDGYGCKTLGITITEGAAFQVVMPAGVWFAAEPAPDSDFTLAGCTVAPGFDFRDFELAEKGQLLKDFPASYEVISRLCR